MSPARSRALLGAAAIVSAGLLATSGATGAALAGSAALLVAALAGVVVLGPAAAATTVDAHGAWRWTRRGCWWLGAGALVDLLLSGASLPGAGWGASAGCLGFAAMLYQGLVRWNRYRTALHDPGDWLNGAGAWAVSAAVVLLVVTHLPGAPDTLGLPLVASVARLAITLVVLGAAATVLAIAGLGRDRRALLIVVALGLVTAAEVVVLGRAVSGPPGAPLPVVPAAVWTVLVLVVSATSTLRPGPASTGYASSQATSAGSVVVVGLGVVVLLVHALADDRSDLVAVLAAAGALAAGTRVLRLVRDLASLASTRIEARTDALTGVANRRALVEAVDTFSARAQGAALMVIDLDRFKEVNDRYGHQVGDRVIRLLADRLQAELPGGALLARLGGDEFAVVLEDPDPDRASAIAEQVCEVLARPVDLDGRVVQVAASVGVASTALGEHRDGELLRCADTAMYVAKRDGGGVRLYDQAADARGRARAQTADQLRALLAHSSEHAGRLVLHYQPQVDAADGRLRAVEALVRWEHPDRGLLPPAEFLDLAEEHGLMIPLTWEVLGQATRQLAAWRAVDPGLRLAVNLSTSSLEHPGLLDVLRAALDTAGLPPSSLVVEITETSLMHHPELAIAVTRQIRAAGIGISIDDYGTGYSSLAYLDGLPAQELKLDRSFIAKLTTDPRTRAIVAGTIALAHQLDLEVVAEGVEDDETRAALAELGCDRTQGYLHGRPAAAADLRAWFPQEPGVPTP